MGKEANKKIRRNILFFILLPMILAIAFLHYLAIENYWYWLLPWADLVMHFLGGLFISLFGLWIYTFSIRSQHREESARSVFAGGICAALVIGLGWEVFEYLAGMFVFGDWVFDTAIDVVFDTIGGGTGVLYFLRFV